MLTGRIVATTTDITSDSLQVIVACTEVNITEAPPLPVEEPAKIDPSAQGLIAVPLPNRVAKYRCTHPKKLLIKGIALSEWHIRYEHLNYRALREHLQRLEVYVRNDVIGLRCDICERVKLKIKYSRCQRRATHMLKLVYNDLYGPISPAIIRRGARYFCTF